VECLPFRTALSAQLDGEDPGVDVRLTERHVAGCSACTAWLASVRHVQALADTAAAVPTPDLSQAITRQHHSRAGDARHDRLATLRAFLAAVGFAQLAAAAPALLGVDAGAPVHLAREIGSWDLALSVGFLFAAWRPARAWGMLPLVTALVVCVVATTGLDIVNGNAQLANESTHLLEVIGLVLVWRLAVQERSDAGRGRAERLGLT
jgi:predicted anti-sigma-YlaC factor YlaD